MKLSCQKNTLLDAISVAQKAVSTKSTLQILEGILLEASDNILKLTGNDLELGIECSIQADIQQTGAIVLNSRIFGDIVRKLPNDTVFLEVQDNNNVYIKCGNSEFNIMGISSVEFPELPSVQKENPFTISQEKLRSMIKQTIFAVGTNENKIILTGSCLEVDEGYLNMVSVDGYRLAMRKEPIHSLENKLSFVIPGKTLNELSKIIKEEEQDINIYITAKHVLFEFDNCRMVSRLLEGEFLNYKQIIPKENHLRLKTSVKPLIESIERAALLIVSDNQKYPVRLNIKTDKIIISCMTQTGKVQDSVKVETEGNDLEIGFNHKYLLDALKACECDEVYMEFNTALSPCIIKAVDNEKFIYLVLPVRLRSE
ncbi:DNA polymerase III subunit beta [Petroclostridium sp. X23]|uniref:DNA polymerase III subunit beta n=1 Tax=Petroclostridium sp. X23 TaxID=3045146 RepID=UPI0024ACF6A5|nr:DNA polymerase III subunit beta [Petroclostridium sp. X23]WHH57247.1 DNA polymerase III subunit beta [Petroclostridium sp. X23]